jgi:uncharacterized protein YggE
MKKTLTLLLILTVTFVSAQERLQSIVSVTGEGTVKIIPDQVTIRMSVENSGDDPVALKTVNDRAVNDVLNFIKQNGIESKDVQTQHVTLNKRYDYNTKTYSYQATQTITVLLKDLKKYDGLISGLMTKGINRIDGISFGTSKLETLKSEARKLAVSNAKEKAVEYAGVLNQTVGTAIQINEQGSYSPPMPLYRAEAMAFSADGVGETLAVGEMEVKATIQIVFELK